MTPNITAQNFIIFLIYQHNMLIHKAKKLTKKEVEQNRSNAYKYLALKNKTSKNHNKPQHHEQ